MRHDPIRLVKHRPVVSCMDAANARGIPLSHELKTLVLRAGAAVFAVHLRGDHRLDSRSVERTFRRNSSFLTADQLAQHSLRPGLLNPWNVPFCTYHLLCLEVLRLPVMATNNSRFDEGQFFHTADLLTLSNLIVGSFGHG